jgi:hypothetical protein
VPYCKLSGIQHAVHAIYWLQGFTNPAFWGPLSSAAAALAPTWNAASLVSVCKNIGVAGFCCHELFDVAAPLLLQDKVGA